MTKCQINLETNFCFKIIMCNISIIMSNIIDRQTLIISVNLVTFTIVGGVETLAQVTLPMNLRFAADELILKSIIYNNTGPNGDVDDNVQIWCNITNDNLIGAFPNTPLQNPIIVSLNQHYRIANSFQTGNFVLQFQNTTLGGPASYNPQSLISTNVPQRTKGTVVLTFDFVKLKDKNIY